MFSFDDKRAAAGSSKTYEKRSRKGLNNSKSKQYFDRENLGKAILMCFTRCISFLVQSALLGWFGGLASLKHYGNKALWQ